MRGPEDLGPKWPRLLLRNEDGDEVETRIPDAGEEVVTLILDGITATCSKATYGLHFHDSPYSGDLLWRCAPCAALAGARLPSGLREATSATPPVPSSEGCRAASQKRLHQRHSRRRPRLGLATRTPASSHLRRRISRLGRPAFMLLRRSTRAGDPLLGVLTPEPF